MTFKATVYDTTNGDPREITPDQILLKDGKPDAIFSSDSQMRYHEFHLWDDTKPCKYNDFKPNTEE